MTPGGDGTRGPGRLLAYALLAIMVAAVFWPVFAHPTEVLYAPRSDLLAFIHPYRVLQIRAFAELGRFTLFDPTSFAGVPLAGDPQAGIFYPPNWLFLLDRHGEGEAFHGWGIVLHLLIGGWGAIWWMRGRGASTPASLAAAGVFVFSGKWLHHVLAQGHVVFLPLVWVPWQCALVERLVRAPSPRRCVALAGATALVLLGAQPQLVLYSQAFVLTWALLALRTRGATAGGGGDAAPRRGNGWPWLAASAALALGLAAIAVWPMFADRALWMRGEGLDYAAAAARSLGPAHLFDWLSPSGPPRIHEAPPFAGRLALPLAALAVLVARPRSVVWFGLGWLGFMAWYALGEGAGLHRWMFDLVPGFDWFRIPPRIFLVMGLPLALLAAAGVDGAARPDATPARRAVAGALAIGGAIGGLRVGGAAGLASAAGWCLPLLVLAPWPAAARRRLPWAIAALLLVDQGAGIGAKIETRPLAAVLGENPVAERLRAPLGEGRVLAFNWRSRADLSVLPATYTTRAGLEGLRGFSPLVPRALHEFVYRGVAATEPPTEPGVTLRTFPIESRPHLDLLNVRWVVTNAPLSIEGLELRETFGPIDVFHYQRPEAFTTLEQTFVYENARRMPRAALVRSARAVESPTAAISALADVDPRRVVLVEDPGWAGTFDGAFVPVPVRHHGDGWTLSVDAGEGGYLLLSELWYPGWRAFEAGERVPIARANGVFQAVKLGPGEHTLSFEYRPREVAWGRGVTGAALLVAVLCLAPWRGGRD